MTTKPKQAERRGVASRSDTIAPHFRPAMPRPPTAFSTQVAVMSSAFTRALVAVVMALSAATAHAATNLWSFTVFWGSGPLAGTSSSGVFGYDSAIATPYASYKGSNYLSFLDFTLNGAHFDQTQAPVQQLRFNNVGNLVDLTFGTSDVFGPYGNDWFVYIEMYYYPPGNYAVAASDGQFSDSTRINYRTVPIPEPSTYALLLVGLVVVVAAGRRRLGRRNS